jgi:cation-dependent mannose-6-phosphate receptor
MHFSSLPIALLITLAIHSGMSAAADEKAVEPCTVASSSGSFYDLRKLSVQPPKEGEKAKKNDKVEDWHAKGYDYGANFTLNICAPVVSEIERPVGIDKKLSQNVSAYYELGSKTYSIGSIRPLLIPKLL